MGLTDFTSGPDDDGGSGRLPGGMVPGLMPGQPGNGMDDDAVTGLLVDYNERFKAAEPTKFRDALIQQVLSVLIGKNKPNVLLKGPAGVGKTKIVEDVARRIALGDPLIPDVLRGHTVYELPIANIIAGSGIIGSLEEKVKAIVEWASDPRNKAILFMDEIHQITGGSGSGGDPIARKVSQILKPALARGDLHVIGATTTNESRAIDADPAFKRRFTHLIVDELTMEQTLEVLNGARAGMMAHYRQKISVSSQVLADIVKIADQNSRADRHRPDSALELLDRSMAARVLEQSRLISDAELAGDAALVTALKAVPQVPLTSARVMDVALQLMTGNAQRPAFDLDALQEALHDRILGQDDVVAELIEALARDELGVFPRKVPITWLFAGTSGVGKTETGKIIARMVTGLDPIILNMSELHSKHSASKIVGAHVEMIGSDSNQEKPFDALESNPFRVIVLDEFEKSHVAVQRLFLSAFDEGHIVDAQGRLIDFSRALIICTTNAAREALSRERVGFGSADTTLSTKSLDKALIQVFDAELLGRFSLIVGFNPIDEGFFRRVMVADYRRERERIVGERPRLGGLLPDGIPDDELATIVRRVFVSGRGARPAGRAVRTWIEDRLLAAQRSRAVATVSPAEEKEEGA